MAHDDQKLELDEIEEPDDLETVDLDDLDDADVVDDDEALVVDDDEALVVDDDEALVVDDDALVVDDALDTDLAVDDAEVGAKKAPVAAAEDEDDDEEDDDDLDPDEVEAGLDVILKDRLVVTEDEEDEEDEEAPDAEERAEAPSKVLVKRPGEFVCQSCFLVKHPSQLADSKRNLCRDCV